MKGLFGVCLSTVLLFGFAAASLDIEETTNSTMGNYTLSKDGKLCFQLEGVLSYELQQPNSKDKIQGYLYDTGNVTTGECEATKTIVTITSEEGAMPVRLDMEFLLNTTTKTWMGGKFALTLLGFGVAYGVAADDLNSQGMGGGLAASSTQGLQCSQANVTVNGTWGKGVVKMGTFVLYPGFTVAVGGDVATCDYDKKPTTSNVVPIAVGCALAGLVLIVLVAYLIGRTRHERQHKGYQSV